MQAVKYALRKCDKQNAIYGMHAIRVCVTIIGRYHHIRKVAVTVLSVKFLK